MRGGFRPWSERVDVDHWLIVWRCLNDITIVMHLDELGLRRGWPAGGRERRRFEGLAEMREDLPDRTRLGDEGDEADVAGACGALERAVLADAGE